MIVRVHDGGRYMPGLVRYLAGPGKANEHTEPHVVAASGSLAEEFAGVEWDAGKAGELAAVLDGAWREARRTAGLPVVPQAGERAGGGAVNPAHVFHVSLSLGADQGVVSDEKWAQIAREYVTAMDFTSAGGKADCQWAAIRHGLSTGGNDHLHIAVCLVREDGTRASDWRSKVNSRRAVDDIERRHGLRPVKDSADERGLPGHSPGEAAKAERLGRAEPDRYGVARRLRSAAATSSTEGEFVRHARASGLLMRPRFAAGTTDVVEGYSAALRPDGDMAGRGERPVWFGGGTLDRNLTLPALRAGWEDSAQAAGDGVEEWRRANRAWRTSVPVPGAEGVRDGVRRGLSGGARGTAPVPGPGRALPRDAAGAVAAVNAWLAAVDTSDRVAWRYAAREAAGVFAAFSLQVEGSRPGALARASDALARSAQPVREERDGGAAVAPAAGTGMGGRHLNLMVRASGRRSTEGWIAVLRQLDRTTQAVHDAHMARGEALRARQVAAEAGHGLAGVRKHLEGVAAAAAPATTPAARGEGRGGATPASAPVSPRLHDPLRPGVRSAGSTSAATRAPGLGRQSSDRDGTGRD